MQVEELGPTWWHSPDGWHAGQPPARDDADVLWVRVASREEVPAVAERLGLPTDVVRSIGAHGAGRHGRPHVQHLSGGVYLTAPTTSYRESTADVLTGEVTCLVLGGVVLTAEAGPAGCLDQVAELLATPQPAPDRLTAGVLSALLAALVATASDVEARLSEAVEAVEETVFAGERTNPVEAIYALKREIAEARRGLVPLGAELADLVTDPDGRDAGDAWARKLVTAVDRLDRRLDAHDELLAALLSSHLALVSIRQGDDVRRISAWAAIVAVPTLVASVYGMNFHHMPELGWVGGYPAALGVMAGLSVLLHRLFTRSGWL
ncbi:CorA family divalent cation transporter [Actinotalea subterranea]|uniref:CorA family divalent cation transporter n=1 Tax=Actinotalea subterranea TaxID=2607497 RepID=UPI00165E906B|nr:CorA family divalent cation transporter [Actinotalea subterranea]